MSAQDCPHSPALPFVRQAIADAQAAAGRTQLNVLDVACGKGRHLCAAAAAGCVVVGIDRNQSALAIAREHLPQATLLAFDVEQDASLPPALRELAPNGFDLVITTFFLFRPLTQSIAMALAPGGRWVLETFHAENRSVNGRPRREAFALQAGEAERLAQSARLSVLSVDEGEHAGTWTTQLVAQKAT